MSTNPEHQPDPQATPHLPATDDQADEPDPWERQPGESKRHYDQFVHFRDTRRPRSLRDVANRLHMHPVSIRRTAARWDWQRRVAAWDDHLDAVYVEEIHEARRRAAREDMIILARMREITMRKLLQPGETTAHLNFDQLGKMARWIDSHMKHARVLYGDPTEHVTVSGPGGGPILTEDWTTLTDEQKRARLHEAAKAAMRRLEAIAETSTPEPTPTAATGQHSPDQKETSHD